MAAAGVQPDSLAYVSREPETLERYVRLDQQANGSFVKNNRRIAELEQLLTTAKQALQGVDMSNINANLFNAIQTINKLTSTKYTISNEILLPFEMYWFKYLLIANIKF